MVREERNDAIGRRETHRFLGVPTILEYRSILPYPAAPEALENLQSRLPDLLRMRGPRRARKRVDRRGQTSRRARFAGRNLSLDIIVREDSTELTVRARISGAASLILGGMLGGMGLGLVTGWGRFHSPRFSILCALAILGAAFLSARGAYGCLTRNVHERLREVAGQAAAILGTPGAAPRL